VFLPLVSAVAATALLSAIGAAYGGPCTAQITQLEQQISLAEANPEVGPSAPETLGAQLHREPTPETLQRSEHKANAAADMALERARKADADGDANVCTKALKEAKNLYGID
jgi:hypothetical protein